MASSISVGMIGATGNTGKALVAGLLSSTVSFAVTSFTRQSSVDSPANKQLHERGVSIVGYDVAGPRKVLVDHLRGIDVLISCTTWEHLHQQIPWIEAAKEAGVQRFVPSEWVGPALRGVIDIRDKKLEILSVIQRARLPYTVIDVGCWFQVFVPKVPSGKSDKAHSAYIDHRIVGDGNQEFALTDMADIGTYVAQIISDPRTLNKCIFVYTEVMSMNEIWDVMTAASGETPPKAYLSEKELHEIIKACRQRLDASSETAHHPSNIMDTANFNMGQYRISWCIRGDNTPEYADYLGYLDFWKLYPQFPKGRSLEECFRKILEESSSA